MAPYEISLRTDPAISEVSLDCDPADRTMIVRMTNGSPETIGFKVLTNSPRRWSVKPNGGVVKPDSSLEVVLTALSESPTLLTRDRHLILTVPLKPEEVEQLRELRSRNVRASLELLRPENPQVSQVRLTPRVGYSGSHTTKQVGCDGYVALANDRGEGLKFTRESTCSITSARQPRKHVPLQVVHKVDVDHAGCVAHTSVVERIAELQLRAATSGITTSAPPRGAASSFCDPTASTCCALPAGRDNGSDRSSGLVELRWQPLMGLLFDELTPWFKCSIHEPPRLCVVVELDNRATRPWQVENVRHIVGSRNPTACSTLQMYSQSTRRPWVVTSTVVDDLGNLFRVSLGCSLMNGKPFRGIDSMSSANQPKESKTSQTNKQRLQPSRRAGSGGSQRTK